MYASETGRDLIKSYEKCELEAYNTDGGGYWTIGWGHKFTDGKAHTGETITQAEADELFEQDVGIAEQATRDALRVPVEQHEFDALVSLCYNIGGGNLKNSKLIELINDGNKGGAFVEFLDWRKSNGQVLRGLIRRRATEAKLYCERVVDYEAQDNPRYVYEDSIDTARA